MREILFDEFTFGLTTGPPGKKNQNVVAEIIMKLGVTGFVVFCVSTVALAQLSHRNLETSGGWSASTHGEDNNDVPLDYPNDYGRQIVGGSERVPREGRVRLTGGQSRAEGNVEYYHLGEWGSICDDEWDIREGAVICRMLDYRRVVQVTHSAFFGKGRGR